MSSEPTKPPRRAFLGACIAGAIVSPLVPGRTYAATDPDLDSVDALLQHADSDAVYHRVVLPDERNAWPVLIKAKELLAPLDSLFEGDSEISLWEEASIVRPLPGDGRAQQLRSVLNEHRGALRIIDEAIRKPALQYPEPEGWKTFDRDSDDIGLFRQCFWIKTLRAKVAFHDEKYADAARDLCDLLRLGQMLARGEGYALHYVVAVAMRADAQRNLCRMIAHPLVSTDVTRTVLTSLERIAQQDDGAAQTLRVELCCFCVPIVAGVEETTDSAKLARSVIAEYTRHMTFKEESQASANRRNYEVSVARLLVGHRSPFDRTETVALASQIAGDDIRMLKIPFIERHRARFETTKKSVAVWPQSLDFEDSFLSFFDFGEFTTKLELPSDADLIKARTALRDVRNPLGKIIAISSADSHVSYISALAEARLSATRLTTALRLFQRIKGLLPDALGSLVEASLLGEVPLDPFDGKPFRYSAKRKVLWSVGEKGMNQGVVSDQDDPKIPFDENSELTWRL